MSEQHKICKICETLKPIEEGFYKTSKSYMSICRKCHNKKRTNYKTNTNYIHRQTGFKKLPLILRKLIISDIKKGYSFAEIHGRYKDVCPTLKYQTLLKWKREKQIKLNDVEE